MKTIDIQLNYSDELHMMHATATLTGYVPELPSRIIVGEFATVRALTRMDQQDRGHVSLTMRKALDIAMAKVEAFSSAGTVLEEARELLADPVPETPLTPEGE